MATKKQVTPPSATSRRPRPAKQKRSIASMPATKRSALGKQGAAVAQRKMGRDELARALGYK